MVSKRVLIVDDAPQMLDTMRSALESESYEVCTCLVSRRALPLAREFRPDVIILDIVMPDFDGWGLLEQLRADPDVGDVRVIICTAYMDRVLGRWQEFQERGAGLLPKPFDLDELLELVAAATHRAA